MLHADLLQFHRDRTTNDAPTMRYWGAICPVSCLRERGWLVVRTDMDAAQAEAFEQAMAPELAKKGMGVFTAKYLASNDFPFKSTALLNSSRAHYYVREWRRAHEHGG